MLTTDNKDGSCSGSESLSKEDALEADGMDL